MDLLQFCTWINDLYNEKMPVIKDTMLCIQNLAKVQGYVTSLSGRHHHRPRPYFDSTTGKWNDGIYKMTNYLIQGSAADILKKGLLDAWNSGVFNTLKMHITVHDENVCSVPKTKEGVEAAAELEACMNNAYKDRLKVPMKAVGGIGDNWNGKHAEDDKERYIQNIIDNLTAAYKTLDIYKADPLNGQFISHDEEKNSKALRNERNVKSKNYR